MNDPLLKTIQSANFGHDYQQYSRLVYSMALHVVLNAQEAEEIVQEIFISYAENIEKVNQPKYWLIRATLNRCFNEYHRKKRHLNYLNQTIFKIQTIFHTITRKVILTEEVHRVLGGISKKERTIVLLKYGYDYEYHEIADLLSMPEGTVKSTLARLKEKINL